MKFLNAFVWAILFMACCFELMAVDPVISEFLASNSSGLEDEDGDSSDWIEIWNVSGGAGNLEGYHLTDDSEDLTKWTFSEAPFNNDGYVVVFASGKDRNGPQDELHTNFKLNSSEGGYLALVEPDGITVASEYKNYSKQFEDISYGSGYGDPEDVKFLRSGDIAKWIVPERPIEGWVETIFDDSSWGLAKTGIGYDRSVKYMPHIGEGGDLMEAMRGVNASAYIRVPFVINDLSGISNLILRMKWEDGFIAYLNGTEIKSMSSPENPQWNSEATLNRSNEDDAITFFDYPVSGPLIEGQNVLAIHGLNASRTSSDFLISPEITAKRTDLNSPKNGFFLVPSPGSLNGKLIDGLVRDTKFSVNRGFYDSPFDLEISTETEGAKIRYTLDGSEPSKSKGILYDGPININDTTILRAIAYKDNFTSTNVDTQTYLFPEKVAVQTNSPVGYPSSWGGVSADYGMDNDPVDFRRAAGNANHSLSSAKSAIADSLKSITTISIVTDKDNIFDRSRGIYQNPSGRGSQWERPVSVEIINGEGADDYQTNAGLRVMGFTSRNLSTTTKLNMRLLFKKEYGDSKMKYPLLGSEGPDEFNTITLRGNIRDAWVTEYQGFGSALYIGDEWSKRSQKAMGQPAVRGTYAHVYLNGMYWGLYNPTERPDDDFAETHLGGDRTEYDVVKFCCPDRSIAGSIRIWDQLLSAARSGLTSHASYQRVQGKNPDGSLNPQFPVLLDVDNLIDYSINGYYHAQVDWPGNYYVIRDRVEGRTTGFQFFTWDNDIALGAANPNNGNKVQSSPGHNWWTESPGEIEIPIRRNAEYRVRFADRVYEHFNHDGAMTVENNIDRWNELAEMVRPALFAESARWGDSRGQRLRTVQDNWDLMNQRMIDNYFPGRQSVLFSQLRSHGLYPDTLAPEFNKRGGVVSPEFELKFDSESVVYYTTDGSDPRLVGGEVNPDAIMVSGGRTILSLIETGAALRVNVPLDGTESQDWFLPDYDDSEWTAGNSGVGYDRGSRYRDLISLDLYDEMRGINSSAYVRIPFEVVEPANFISLYLRMKSDDGFVVYLNGVRVAEQNAPDQLAWNSTATASPNDDEAMTFKYSDITFHKNLLVRGDNVLAIHALNDSSGSSDFLIIPELAGDSLEAADTISMDRTTVVRARALDGNEWSPMNEATYIVGSKPTSKNLVVSEIMYHPSLKNEGDEFIEVMNISQTEEINLTSVKFDNGISYEFPVDFILGPGKRAVIASDPDALRVDWPDLKVVGQFNGNLNNGGERVTLVDSEGVQIQSFKYNDKLPWPESPDGQGPSLVLKDPLSGPDHSEPENWRASGSNGGSPGFESGQNHNGEDLIRYAIEEGPDFNVINGILSIKRREGVDDVLIVPQWSEDLRVWQGDGFEAIGEDPTSWKISNQVLQKEKVFYRFEVRYR